VYPANLKAQKNDPTGSKGDALDQPGLLQMTTKAIDIVQTRSNGNGWFIMSEAASIDKISYFSRIQSFPANIFAPDASS
jgi:alkaline phosphatase